MTREVGVPFAVNEYVVIDCVRMKDGAKKARPRRVIVKNILGDQLDGEMRQ